MDLELDSMVLEISFHFRSIEVVDVEIGYCETPLPFLVAICKIGILDIKDTIDECEVIFNLLIALDVETRMA